MVAGLSCWIRRGACTGRLLWSYLTTPRGAAPASCTRAIPHAPLLPPFSCLELAIADAPFPPMQPAVVAAAQVRAEDESLIVRLTLPPGVSSTFHENDMMLISRDNPEVSRQAAATVGWAAAVSFTCTWQLR